MSDPFRNQFSEPEVDPLADTSPIRATQQTNLNIPVNRAYRPRKQRRRRANFFSLLASAAFVIVAIAVLVLPGINTTPPAPPAPPVTSDDERIPTVAPTIELIETQTGPDNIVTIPTSIPTISAETIAQAVQRPIEPVVDASSFASSARRSQFDPFTVIPERARTTFTQYVAKEGDTANAIARQFSLEINTLGWCNDPGITNFIIPGDVINIPPTDGACHQVLGSQNKTLREIAEDYRVDVFDLIDSPYNLELASLTPDTVLPGGTTLFIPGGQGLLLTWNPGITVELADGRRVSASSVANNPEVAGQIRFVTFAPDQPGSCGRIAAAGGTFWNNPLPNGKFIRGFTNGHSGLDIAANEGTPVVAANGGPVIFAGWNNYGYGNTIVVAHGGVISTLYAHLSQINVSCGEFVQAGQVIGAVGTTGNSSGPHLHFEIRSGDVPMNPSGTPGIGF